MDKSDIVTIIVNELSDEQKLHFARKVRFFWPEVQDQLHDAKDADEILNLLAFYGIWELIHMQ